MNKNNFIFYMFLYNFNNTKIISTIVQRVVEPISRQSFTLVCVEFFIAKKHAHF